MCQQLVEKHAAVEELLLVRALLGNDFRDNRAHGVLPVGERRVDICPLDVLALEDEQCLAHVPVGECDDLLAERWRELELLLVGNHVHRFLNNGIGWRLNTDVARTRANRLDQARNLVAAENQSARPRGLLHCAPQRLLCLFGQLVRLVHNDHLERRSRIDRACLCCVFDEILHGAPSASCGAHFEVIRTRHDGKHRPVLGCVHGVSD